MKVKQFKDGCFYLARLPHGGLEGKRKKGKSRYKNWWIVKHHYLRESGLIVLAKSNNSKEVIFPSHYIGKRVKFMVMVVDGLPDKE